MNRKIRPTFTKEQFAEVRLALEEKIEWRYEQGMDRRAASNALKALERAYDAARR